ncbi:MAG: glutamyl-tRNA reductase [Lachnospiraceae bacterium]
MYYITSAGIDYSTANIEIREKFSLTKAKQIEFYTYLKSLPDVLGATILSTCNRMELYLSLKEGSQVEAFSLICTFLNIEEHAYVGKRVYYEQTALIEHLCLLACGAKSQIFGEDQIITQIKSAILLSREEDMTDSIMEVLFRTAISCGKKIKTTVNLTQKETSIADYVIDTIMEKKFPVEKVLVIGNGEMGRYMGEKLVRQGFMVWMSVREYRHSKVQLPKGCMGVDYSKIYEKMQEVDAVVSATLSPHFTVKYQGFSTLLKKPKYLFDLAVPRDVDTDIASIEGICIYDVDELSKNGSADIHTKQLIEIKKITQKFIADFEKWYSFKEGLCIYGEADEA